MEDDHEDPSLVDHDLEGDVDPIDHLEGVVLGHSFVAEDGEVSLANH